MIRLGWHVFGLLNVFVLGIQPVLPKKISPECSLEGLMLKLKLQYFGHLMRRADSFEKTWCWGRLKVGGEGDDRGWDGWMASLTQWTWVWVNSGSWWWTGRPGVLQSTGSQRVGHDWVTELNWTDTKVTGVKPYAKAKDMEPWYQGHLQNWPSPIATVGMNPSDLNQQAPWPHVR